MIIEITSDNEINWNAKTEEEKKVNEIICLVKTRLGEIPFLRNIGVSDEFIDKPITLIKPVLINDITAVISENVKDVTLQAVEILAGESVGDYYVKVVCEF